MGSSDFLSIDENQLDREWLKQPNLMYEHAEKLADARRDEAVAKSNLEVVRARLVNKIRNDPEKAGLDKVTEKAIEAKALTHKKYTEAHSEMLDANYAVAICQAAVNAIEHRKRALEGLVSLHGQNYFSVPRTSKENMDHMTGERAERVRRKKRKRSSE